MADGVDAYLRELEDDYEKPPRVRRFFARRPRLLRPNLGAGGPPVSITLAAGQGNPVNTGPINFTVTFSEPATGFTNADVSFNGSTVDGTLAAAVTGTGPVYNVAVTGMTGNGIVVVSIPAGSATNARGLPFAAASAATVTLNTHQPTVTINVAADQVEPAGVGPVNFTVVFSEPVSGFTGSDVTITGTAGGTKTAAVSGGPVTFNVAVSGMTTLGTVVADIPAGAVTDLAGNLSLASTSTDNSVFFNPAMGSAGDGDTNFGAAEASGLVILFEDI